MLQQQAYKHCTIVGMSLDGCVGLSGIQKDFGKNTTFKVAKRRAITSAIVFKHADFSTAAIGKVGAAHRDASRFEAITQLAARKPGIPEAQRAPSANDQVRLPGSRTGARQV
jgi:hypothetical protein